jgi:hypothetical protein
VLSVARQKGAASTGAGDSDAAPTGKDYSESRKKFKV